jgi:large subunit ribosomal protein L21
VYAIIRAGGRQLRVAPGATVTVDGTAGEAGSEIAFDQVLLVEQDGGEVHAGSPYVAKARVLGIIDGPAHGPKIRVFKKKRRKTMRHTQGHRAQLTRVRITDIQV